MHEIVFVADVHEGINFGFRVDPQTGVSERAMDLHRNFVAAARHAVDVGASLFVVLGDLFDRTNVAPVFREIVRRDVVEPLGRAGVEIWLVAGNHDQPRSFARSTSLDDFRGYDHVRVFRKPQAVVRDVGGRSVAFLVLPYLHPEQVAAWVRRRLGDTVPRDEAYVTAQRLFKKWIEDRVAETEADLTVLLGHYYLEGATIASTTRVEVLPGEFGFTRDMIPADVDLGLFGHVHKHQRLWDKCVYVGAPERIDWGERLDPKGFLALNVADGSWEFLELPAREMVKVDVALTMDTDPTQTVLDALPENLADRLVRLEISLPEALRARIDEGAIAERLRAAFYAEVRWTPVQRDRLLSVDFTLDPLRLLRDFVSVNYADHPRREALLHEAEEILKEALA
jgi:exonuclease SbcD